MAANVRASASSASRPVRSTPWPSRTIRLSTTEIAGRSPMRSLMVLVPQSIAATIMWVGRWSSLSRPSPGATQGPDLHQSPSRSSTSSPRGLAPRPWARDCPASTCRHFTRSGIPPAEMPSISGTEPMAATGGEVGLVRGGVRRGQFRLRAQPVLHLLHQPRRLERPDLRGCPRTGEVEGGRERGAVVEPGFGGDDVRVATRAAVSHLVDGAGRAAELGGDCRLVGRGDHRPGAAGPELALAGLPASSTDSHAVSHQGVGSCFTTSLASCSRSWPSSGLPSESSTW